MDTRHLKYTQDTLNTQDISALVPISVTETFFVLHFSLSKKFQSCGFKYTRTCPFSCTSFPVYNR